MPYPGLVPYGQAGMYQPQPQFPPGAADPSVWGAGPYGQPMYGGPPMPGNNFGMPAGFGAPPNFGPPRPMGPAPMQPGGNGPARPANVRGPAPPQGPYPKAHQQGQPVPGGPVAAQRPAGNPQQPARARAPAAAAHAARRTAPPSQPPPAVKPAKAPTGPAPRPQQAPLAAAMPPAPQVSALGFIVGGHQSCGVRLSSCHTFPMWMINSRHPCSAHCRSSSEACLLLENCMSPID